MELLLSILLWLGLISNGNTYTLSQIQELEAQHNAAITARATELQQNGYQATESNSDVIVLGM